VTCRFPGCENLPEAASARPGRPGVACDAVVTPVVTGEVDPGVLQDPGRPGRAGGRPPRCGGPGPPHRGGPAAVDRAGP